jgi:hypothetical protein
MFVMTTKAIDQQGSDAKSAHPALRDAEPVAMATR